jgi:hypothetical protein
MANNSQQKPGLTTFGWLALGATAAAVLSSSARRDKLKTAAGDLFNKFSPAAKPSDPAA